MASEYTIKMNFQKARQQANRLDEIANEMNSLNKRDFASTIQTARNNWQGDSADLYIGKSIKLQGNITDVVNSIHAAARDIRTVAQKMYEAEMNALRIAQERNYK